jgi:hypothetical protein
MRFSLACYSSRPLRAAVPLFGNTLLWALVLIVGLLAPGCASMGDALGLGRFRGIERGASDESYYLLKDIALSSSSINKPREIFDHKMNDRINLFFVLRNETPTYVAESIWYDPNDQEFRTIRTTHDRSEETKTGIQRPKGGTTRVHTIATQELYNHKPGLWKVALYIDKQLARRQTFFLR